jgi:hypothetical protein
MSSLSPPAGGRFIPPPLISDFVITDGLWHRIGFVWNGSHRTLYVDDVEVAIDTQVQTGLASAYGGLHIGAGKNLEPGSFFSGLIDNVCIYDRALTEFATQPNPANGAKGVPVDTALSWSPGLGAATHDVYFGTSSPPAFIGNQAEISYDPGGLKPSTTYYWQVDEIKADGTTKNTGDVWSFTTEPGNATQPNPADGAVNVAFDKILSWSPGPTAATHDVYLGTTSPPAFVGNLTEISYDPGPLELGTTYYWQVDAIEADGMTKYTGDVWSFTTAATVGVKKGAYLIYPGDNTQMTVLWQLDATRDCTLEWGTDTNYGNSVTLSEYGSDHQHQYTITSLTPGTKYYYRVQVEVGYLTGSFLAAPAADVENVKFLAYGDTRTNPDIHDAVNAQMIATYTADLAYQTFTMLTGDWVASGDNESDWINQFFDRSLSNTMKMQANLPINGCIGNHEQSGTVFEKYWPYPYESDGMYWSFDYGAAHIVVLDQFTTSYASGSPQYIWLENDLANTTVPWKFIQLHAPGWSAGRHGNNSAVQNDIQPLCETYGVDIVFAGHNHNYARAMVNGVAHITTGGGGAPLYEPEDGHPNIVVHDRSHHFCKIDIQGKQLTFEAVRLDGTVIDTFTMSH